MHVKLDISEKGDSMNVFEQFQSTPCILFGGYIGLRVTPQSTRARPQANQIGFTPEFLMVYWVLETAYS